MHTRTALAVGLVLILLATPVMAQESSPSAAPSGSPEPLLAASPNPSMSPEVEPEVQCVPVDPATLPKGAAKFEMAVSALDADLVAIEERALANGANKKKSAAILEDLYLVGEDFARSVNKIDFDRKTSKAATKVVGSVADGALLVATAYTGSKLDPVPEALSLPDGHAAIAEFRTAAGYSWPCEAGTSAAEPSPDASPVMAEPSPEATASSPPVTAMEEEAAKPLALGPYRLDKVLNGDSRNISDAQFKKAIERAVSVTARRFFAGRDLSEAEMQKKIANSQKALSTGTLVALRGGPSYKASGSILVSNVVAFVQAAQDAATQGDRKLADAWMQVAQANYRAALTSFTRAGGFSKSVFAKALKKKARKQGVE